MSRHIFHMKGAIYSKHKVDWKKVLKAYDMKWRGDMTTWIWEGEGEKLVAVFDRDMSVGERGVTLDAYLKWEGNSESSDFKEAFIDYWEKIPGVNAIDKMPDEQEIANSEEAMEKWIQKERGRIERMRTEKSPYTGMPAPEGYILAAERDLEEKIREKRADAQTKKRRTVDEGFF